MGLQTTTKEEIEEITANYPQTLEQMRESQERRSRRFENGDSEPNEAMLAYTAKMKTVHDLHQEKERLEKSGQVIINEDVIVARAMKAIQRPQKQLPQIMDYEIAKRIVWKIGNAVLAERGRKWEIEDEQKEVIESLVRYFINDPEGRLDVNRGIYLWGNVGRGKTFLFEVMKAFADAVPITPKRFRIATCTEIADKLLWNKGETGDQMANYHHGSWMFDDLGNEPGAVKSYGNEVQVMERLLVARYQRFTDGLCITHVTSNDKPDEIEGKYGTRFYDRAKEMFNFVYLRGNTKRFEHKPL